MVSIDGRPIASYTLDQVTTLFEGGKPGQKHALEILRDGKKRKLTLELKTLL